MIWPAAGQRAAAAGDVETVKLLLAEGADANARTADRNAESAAVGGVTALFPACQQGRYDVAKALLNGRAKIKGEDAERAHPFFEALGGAKNEASALRLMTL